MHWYVVQSEKQAEKIVVSEIGACGFETFLPMQATGKRRGPGERPLFPSYVFTELDLMNKSWCRILRARGVLTILGVNRAMVGEYYPPPLPLPDGFVEGLRDFLAHHGGIMPEPKPTPLPVLEHGTHVTIIDGVFAGFEAMVDLDEGERTRLLLDILGGQATTVIPRKSIAPKECTSVSL